MLMATRMELRGSVLRMDLTGSILPVIPLLALVLFQIEGAKELRIMRTGFILKNTMRTLIRKPIFLQRVALELG